MVTILSNKLGVEMGKETCPVKVPAKFIKRLFEIEQMYESKRTFSINEGGTLRLENHIANADFQVMLILCRCCDAYGYIELTNKKALYNRLAAEFVVSISDSQFYESIEKFIRNDLIQLTNVDGMMKYRLNHYINETTQKMERYVLIHPVVFTKEFRQLSLAAKKLFFMAYEQTGGKPGKTIMRNFKPSIRNKKGYQPFIYKDLRSFLHKTQDSHILSVINELQNSPVKSCGCTGFISNVLFNKNAEGSWKVSFTIHSTLVVPVQYGINKEINEPLDMSAIYPAKTKFIVRELNRWGVGEVTADKFLLNRLIVLFKGISPRIIRQSFKALQEYVSRNSKFPSSIYGFLFSTIDRKMMDIYVDALNKSGLRSFLVHPHYTDEERKNRFNEFKHFISSSKLGIRKFKKICQMAAPYLKKNFFAPLSSTDYLPLESLAKLSVDIDKIRLAAIEGKVDPYEYHALEDDVFTAIDNGLEVKDIEKWLLNQILCMPIAEGFPLISRSFRLEKYLEDKILPVL